jgi:thiamine biosynthesis lipoprotein ApbE
MLDRDQWSRLLRVAPAFAAVVGMPTAAVWASGQVGAAQSFDYHQQNVLGTAMDLTVVAATRADADAAEQAVLAEIGRLQKVLSAYEPDAELAKLNASPVGGPGLRVSPELIDVLKRYDVWFRRTGGAYSGHAGDLIAVWKQAEKDGHVPDEGALATAAKRSAAPAWEIDESAQTVRRVSDQQINVDSLGKGYIIEHAVAAATLTATGLRGLLLSIGGDLRTWGTPTGAPGALWSVGVQDPAHPELNAKPISTLYVPGGRSVSTSGAYQRFYTIDGRQYSHILDATTGQPAKTRSATVVAGDSATANALATICCAVRFAEAFELVRSVPGAEAMVVNADGVTLRTDGFKELQDAAQAKDKFGPRVPSNFPAGYKLTVDLETVPTSHKPYVFVWVTDANGKHVKTLGAWGDDPKYVADMRQWSKAAHDDRTVSVRSVTHATQPAGKYPLSWDGTNQKGSGVPLGRYTIWIEVSAEHGPYAAKFGSITLGQEPAQAVITKSIAFKDVTVTYGPGAR